MGKYAMIFFMGAYNIEACTISRVFTMEEYLLCLLGMCYGVMYCILGHMGAFTIPRAPLTLNSDRALYQGACTL